MKFFVTTQYKSLFLALFLVFFVFGTATSQTVDYKKMSKADLQKRIAVFGLYQILMFSAAASMITIVVSIAIHSVSTREKLVKKFRLSQSCSRTKKVIKNASGIAKLAIKASFPAMKTKSVRNTKINVCVPLFVSMS